MSENNYDYQNRINRRRRYRQRQRRRKTRDIFLLIAGLLLIGVAVLCLVLRDYDAPPDSGDDPAGSQSGVNPSGGEQDLSGGEEDPSDGEEDLPGGAGFTSIKDDWNLILVNPWNPVPDDYTVTLKTLPNGLDVDARCYVDLMNMLDGVSQQGMTALVCSAYRSMELQQRLFDAMVADYEARGYVGEEAVRKAAQEVAVPGTSEHHLGLAVDIVDVNYQLLDENQENTAVQKWLMANSWRYGFILRYPNDKTEITGIIYEPWHYRYVGKEYAEAIYRSGLCYEEWLAEQP